MANNSAPAVKKRSIVCDYKTSAGLADKESMIIGNAAVQGIHSAESLLNSAATHIASQTQANSPASDQVTLSADAVALIQARDAVAANVNSYRTGDQMERAVLDIVG